MCSVHLKPVFEISCYVAKHCGAVLTLWYMINVNAVATDMESEIQHLLAIVAESPCTFVRNGTTYTAEDAASHLSMKYSRGKKYVANSEQFTYRIASKSSLSRQPYHIQCPGMERQTTREWLTRKLESLRDADSAGQK